MSYHYAPAVPNNPEISTVRPCITVILPVNIPVVNFVVSSVI
jgi:hypothetical protein